MTIDCAKLGMHLGMNKEIMTPECSNYKSYTKPVYCTWVYDCTS